MMGGPISGPISYPERIIKYSLVIDRKMKMRRN